MRIVLAVIGVVVGIIAGMIFMMGLHMATFLVYPLPEGVEFGSSEPEAQERFIEWIGTLPAGAWLLTAASHGLGCMFGAAVAMLISGRRSIVPPLVVGVFFTLCGIMNLVSLPHPAWFPFVDVPLYLVLTIVAIALLKRKSGEEKPATE